MAKVSILTHNLERGAMANLAIRYGAALATGGHDVVLVCYSGNPNMGSVHPDNRVTHLRSERAYRSAIPLIRHLNDCRPDVLLSFPTFINLITIVACRVARAITAWQGKCIPVLTHPIALAEKENLKDSVWGARMLYPLADGFVAISPGPKHEIRQWPHTAKKRIAVVPPPLPWKAHIRPERGVEKERALFVTVSRLVDVKRHDLLLKAFSRVHEKEPSAHLAIIGDGPRKQDILLQIQSLGLEEAVQLLGFVRDPLEWMARASAFVLASDEEGFGQVLVEAMSVGCAVISTDARGGGPHYILDGGRYGALVPRGDARALASAMLDAMTEPQRTHWADAALVRSKRFSTSTVGRDFSEFLGTL